MIQAIAMTLVFGVPLFILLGAATFLLFISAAIAGRLALKGVKGFSIKRHLILVALAFLVAAFHITLVIGLLVSIK